MTEACCRQSDARRRRARRGRSRSASLVRHARPAATRRTGSLRPPQGLNKIPNTLLQRVKRLVKSGGAKFRDVGLREVLVLVAQLGRSVDEPELRRTSDRRAHRIDEVEKTACGAGSHVE